MGKTGARRPPYRAQPLMVGIHWVDDDDHAPRTYGWHRLPDSGLVVSVGLADDPGAGAAGARDVAQPARTSGVLSCRRWPGGGDRRGPAAMARAASVRRAAEAGLKEAQQLAGLGSWECDLATGQLHWSDEVYRTFEVDPATVRPFERFLEWVHPTTDDGETASTARSVTAGPTTWCTGWCCLGERIKASAARDRIRRRPPGARSRVRCRTSPRCARRSDALQQLNDELESRVSRRTSELAQANW